MAHDLYAIQQTIKAYVDSQTGFLVASGGIEEAQTLAATQGELKPHIVLRFGSPQPYEADKSFGGARYDGAYSAVDVMAVGSTDAEARELGSGIGNLLLGYKPSEDTGELNYDWGGGTFTVISEGSRPQFYINWVSFRFNFNMSNVGA
jgi:hypothetical protein